MAEEYLKLTKIRIRGLGSVIDSSWVKTGSKMTVFCLPASFDRVGFSEALQSINPPCDILKTLPFREYPNITRKGKYQKRVRPDRRTIALAIFTAQPALVHRLAQVTPHLYETDRIEVGRRMNYTRWINFVEIASSTRWSEVVSEFENLLQGLDVTEGDEIFSFVQSLLPTDRIKDTNIAAPLTLFLDRCRKDPDMSANKVADLLFKIERHDHFKKAKREVAKILPTFLMVRLNQNPVDTRTLDGNYVISTLKEETLQKLQMMKEGIQDRSIIIFDELGCQLGSSGQTQLREFAKTLSESYQVIYLASEEAPTWLSDSDKIISLEDML